MSSESTAVVEHLRRLDRLALRQTEVAELLGVSRDTVKRMVRDGELPVVRLRGSVRIPRKALERWIDEHVEAVEAYR